MRRDFIRFLALGLGLASAVATAPLLAQTYRSKPVRVVVPFAAGGPVPAR